MMAKPEAWRLDLASYPEVITTQTRFQDLDPNGHLNNVAFAALFENARVRSMLRPMQAEQRQSGDRTLVVSITINYLAEGSFPDDVTLATGIGHIGRSSWVIVQAMFQNGRCIATADSVIAMRNGEGAVPLPDALRTWLMGRAAKPV